MERDKVRSVQHLLRHLDDAGALRRNPLVRHLFDAGAARTTLALVRTRVLLAARMLLSERGGGRRSAEAAKRRYEILMRCDLGNELHRVVADDLGLSPRQFYRERLRACAQLAEFLTKDAQQAEPEDVQVLPSEFELRLNCAAGLRNYGQLDAALSLLHGLAAEAVSTPDRIRAWCEVAAVLCDAGRISEAREALDRTWRAFGAADLTPANRELCSAEIYRSTSIVDWAGGAMREAMAANERAMAALRAGECTSERGLELGALVTIGLAGQFREMGECNVSLGLLEEARELVERLRDPAPALRTSLAGNTATTYALTTGGISTALDHVNRHLELARHYNLQRESADALSTLCLIHTQRRDLETALSCGRSALALARTISSAEDFAYCALNVSRIEAALGRPSAAINLINEVRSRAERSGTVWLFADMSEAETLLHSKSYRRVASMASECAQTFERLGMERYLGSALRIQAEALAALGDDANAASAITTAIEILERRGHAFSLAQAYEVSAKVTKNARHRTAANELFAIING